MRVSSEPVVAAAAAARAVAPPLVPAHAFAIALALAVEGLVDARAGAVLCALLVAGGVNLHVALAGRDRHAADATLLLTLVPLAGLLAVALPIAEVPVAGWALLVCPPVLLAAALAAKHVGTGLREIGLTARPGLGDIAVALSGIPLSLFAYAILAPAPAAGPTWLPVMAVVLLALTEELVLRGLLLPRLEGVAPGAGLRATAALSAVAALATHSAAATVLAGAVAFGFGIARRRSGSIAGVTAARMLLLGGLIVVWPHVLGGSGSVAPPPRAAPATKDQRPPVAVAPPVVPASPPVPVPPQVPEPPRTDPTEKPRAPAGFPFGGPHGWFKVYDNHLFGVLHERWHVYESGAKFRVR